jgi:hypothetical protein
MRSLLGDEGRMFSLRTPQEDLHRLLGHMSTVPTLILMGGSDEYVAANVDAVEHVRTLLSAMQPGEVRTSEEPEKQRSRLYSGESHEGAVFYNANHSFEGHEEAMAEFIHSWMSKVLGLS